MVAHRGPGVEEFRSIDLTGPTALVLGAELDGPAPEAMAGVDRCVSIPVVGVIESLNVSVAAALILFEAERQRQARGLYDRPRLPQAERERLAFEWMWPRVADAFRRRGWAYPELDDEGHVCAGQAGQRPALPSLGIPR